MNKRKIKQKRFNTKNFLKTNWKERLADRYDVYEANGPFLPHEYFIYVYHLRLIDWTARCLIYLRLILPAGKRYEIDSVLEQIKESAAAAIGKGEVIWLNKNLSREKWNLTNRALSVEELITHT